MNSESKDESKEDSSQSNRFKNSPNRVKRNNMSISLDDNNNNQNEHDPDESEESYFESESEEEHSKVDEEFKPTMKEKYLEEKKK